MAKSKRNTAPKVEEINLPETLAKLPRDDATLAKFGAESIKVMEEIAEQEAAVEARRAIDAKAEAYRRKRSEDERLYHTGLLGRAPQPGERAPVDDFRLQGQLLPLAPFMLRAFSAPPAQLLAGQMGSMSALDALKEMRKRLGWLE